MIYVIIIGFSLIATLTLILGAPVGLLVALAGRAAPVWVVRITGAGLGVVAAGALLWLFLNLQVLDSIVTRFTVILAAATLAAVLAPWVAWGKQSSPNQPVGLR